MAERPGKLSSSGALVFGLLSLPFVAGGIIAASMSWRAMSESDAMRSWIETPATITRAELDINVSRHHGYQGRDMPRGHTTTTYHLIAAYVYDFGGQRYAGNRVSVHGDRHSTSAGVTFLFNAHRELKRHQGMGKPFHCFVNPHRPSESVLYRDVPWRLAADYTLFATLFGTIGFGILGGVLASTWRRWRPAAAGATADGKPSGVALVVLGFLVAWWTIALFPLVTRLPDIFRSASVSYLVVMLVFLAVGAMLWLAFLYQIVRQLARLARA